MWKVKDEDEKAEEKAYGGLRPRKGGAGVGRAGPAAASGSRKRMKS